MIARLEGDARGYGTDFGWSVGVGDRWRWGHRWRFGAMAGSNDVAMNAQGVAVERRMGTPTMSRFHGMFSLAAIFGAAAGGLFAARAIPVPEHFLITAAIFLAFALSTAPLLMESRPDKEAKPSAKLRIR